MRSLIEKLGLGDGTMSAALWIGLSFVLLIIVMALAVWLVRMLRPSLNISGGQGRGGRPQRLAVTDAFSLDRDGRRLVIIRRDNVEHLLLIGGPNDVLVEANIARNERALRERGATRGPDQESVQAAEAALTGESVRIEPALAPAMTPALPSASIAPPAQPRPAPVARAQQPLAATQAPLSAPAVSARAAPQIVQAPPSTPQQIDDDFEKALAAMQVAQQQQAQARQLRSEPPPQAPSAPAPSPIPAPQPVAPPPPAEAPPPRPAPMSDMAKRLNEVLQKPLSGQLRAPFNKPIPPVPPMGRAPAPVEPAPTPAAPVPPALAPTPQQLPPLPPELPGLPGAVESAAPPSPPVAQKGATAESEMDLLEEEMARLLGRPAPGGKQDK